MHPLASNSDSLGLYLHVPFCKVACPYCDFYKVEMRTRSSRTRLDFPDQIVEEARLLTAAMPELSARSLDTIFLGGGTPSTLVPAAVGHMIHTLGGAFGGLSAEAEITLEANPENLTGSRCRQWRDAAINRLSIGIQSFHAKDLELLGRRHEPATIDAALAEVKRAGFGNFSLDLMFALPGQTLALWLENVDRALAWNPTHLSFYGLTYHEDTAFDRWRREGAIAPVEEELQAEMYAAAGDRLVAAGFEHYEISNFARPGHRARHNSRYWTHRDVIGLGPGAHSNLENQRWRNPDDLEAWAGAIAQQNLPRTGLEQLTAEANLREELFTRLRQSEGLDRTASPVLHAHLERWISAQHSAADAWFTRTSEHIAFTRAGWLLSDAVLDAVIQSADGLRP